MRATIFGFLTATLYTLAIGTLFAMSMPSQSQLKAFIVESQTNAASNLPAQAVDAQAVN